MEQSRNTNPSDTTELAETQAHQLPAQTEVADRNKDIARYHNIKWFEAIEAGNKLAEVEHGEAADEALDGILHPEQATSKSFARMAVDSLRRLFTTGR